MKLSQPQAEQAESNEEEHQKVIKMMLEKKFKRQMSKCVGRGALELGTIETLPTEKLNIPKISEKGFTLLNFEHTVKEEKENVHWANFHNGVAAALRISHKSFLRTGNHQSYSAINNTRNWIMYHRPSVPNTDHGGFLLGLGLLGQLDTLQPTDVYQHLKTAHDGTKIGMLLGRAASKIGK